MAQAAYSWPDREFLAAQYMSGYVAASGAGASSIYGPGFNTARGYEPFQTVAPIVGTDGLTTRALLVGGKRRAVRVASPALPVP